MIRRALFRAAMVCVAAALSWAQEKPLEGTWRGTLATGGPDLRLVLRIDKDADGKLKAAVDSLDQPGANNIPVSSIERNGDSVKFELKVIAATYDAKLNAAGDELKGTWSQGGGQLPLTFKRDTGKTAEAAKPEFATEDYLRWFDHWLKGIDNGIDKEPPVSLFVMGSNKWLHGPTYPPQTRMTKLYLATSGKGNPQCSRT